MSKKEKREIELLRRKSMTKKQYREYLQSQRNRIPFDTGTKVILSKKDKEKRRKWKDDCDE